MKLINKDLIEEIDKEKNQFAQKVSEFNELDQIRKQLGGRL